MSNTGVLVSPNTTYSAQKPLAPINSTYNIIGSPTVELTKVMGKRSNRNTGGAPRKSSRKQTPISTSQRHVNATYSIEETTSTADISCRGKISNVSQAMSSKLSVKDENNTSNASNLQADEEPDMSIAIENIKVETYDKLQKESSEWDRLLKNYDTQEVASKSRKEAIENDPENPWLALRGRRRSQCVMPTWGLDCEKVKEEVQGYVVQMERSALAIREHRMKQKALRNPNENDPRIGPVRSSGLANLRSSMGGDGNITCLEKSTRTIFRKAFEK